MSFLTVDEINVGYGEFQALFGISLKVEQGETVAIIGANGAGKSTLLNSIAGVLTPTKGAISYKGKPVGALTAHHLVEMGIALVPEGRKIFPSLSVEENLMIGGYAKRKGAWDLKAVYELFPILEERRHNRGTALSGGQQQMLAIGRALMSNPDLILMDEISLGLAPVIVTEIYQTVRRISQMGVTTLLVEQDVSRGLKEADHFYCLLEGEVSLKGSPDGVNQTQVSEAYFGV